MDTATLPQAPVVVALWRALDAYAGWISGVARPTDSSSSDTSIGQVALQEVLAIRSTWFPHLTREATELLVAHIEITTMLYECQPHRLREGTTREVGDVDRLEGLVQRQLAAIEVLRNAVGPGR